MSYSLNSLKGVLIGDYIGLYREIYIYIYRVEGLGSKLLKGGYVGDYMGEYYRAY